MTTTKITYPLRISKRPFQLLATTIALISILAYTLVHTGSLLGRFIKPTSVGYVAAFGIELAIVSLSLRIGDIKRSRQDPRFFYGVLLLVLVVSSVANVSEGFETRYGDELPSVGWASVAVGLAATLLLPIVVLALSEIVGTDVEHVAKEREKKAKTRQIELVSDSMAHVRQAKVAHQAQRREQLVNVLADNPRPNITQVATQFGVDRSTLYDDLKTLVDSGVVHKNGQGWQVVG